ncbi:hypothetical protein [Desulfoluna sp.]|uniref:hypothetical protein n=1 Tax=Desulfoluna sp. TaxID=2045199 RepID=UPI0026386897|nr:hypothetical protein [Desulfoluna sp.]
MHCKGCGRDLLEHEYKAVAHWYFCLECFDALLQEKRDPPSAAPGKPAAEDAHPKCIVCKKTISEGTARDLLGLTFCGHCYEGLVKRPKPRLRREKEEQVLSPAVEQIRVDVSKTVECQGCGRRIPAIGSKDIDGRPHCPDCFYARKG